VASTGYKRKYAIRLLSLPEIPQVMKIKRPRPRFYGKDVQDALLVAWNASNCIASKRLAPFLKDLVPALEHHGYLNLVDKLRNQLINISPASIDRILKPIRNKMQARGISTTRKGKLLKHQIPVRTFSEWKEKKPGFFEIDLVAHCGNRTDGAFLYTLVLTDIATEWIECLPLLHRSGHAVIDAINHARQLIPFPVLGLDSDNGSEFINSELIDYCKREEITFTRGRAYKKNDQCFVEQKNGAVVRQTIGYDRFEGLQAYKQLSELYRAVRLYFNFFQPSMKLQKKRRENSKTHRIYDTAKTPVQRLYNTRLLKESAVLKLKSINQSLDPVRLLRQVEALQDALWQHAIIPTDPTVSEQSNQGQKKDDLHFNPDICGLSLAATDDTIDANLDNSSMDIINRKYKKKAKPKVERYWRTRKDPFESVWNEICVWLENNPEGTAKSLLQKLHDRYPGAYNNNQLRTLQRRVKKWRANSIITFNDDWIYKEIISDVVLNENLTAVPIEDVNVNQIV